MKTNVWRITGYLGKNDYDGQEDDNTRLDIIFDGRLKKEEVEDLLCYYWGKLYRSVAIKAELIKEN